MTYHQRVGVIRYDAQQRQIVGWLNEVKSILVVEGTKMGFPARYPSYVPPAAERDS